MGSLPNLNDKYLEKAERRAEERERELARERARERDFARDNKDSKFDKDRLPIFIHQNKLPLQHHHRHSLTSRRVLRTRSSGAAHHIWDDPMSEHMLAYSPISSRSHRTGLMPYQIQTSSLGGANRHRRESINSSIGATSVRRLITINNRTYGCRHKIPIHVRAKITKNFILLVLGHGLICAALIPLMGLQGSNSIWFKQEKSITLGPDIGSGLLSMGFIITAGMCLLTTRIIRRCGYIFLIAMSYLCFCIFLSAHLSPSLFVLLPAYLLFGITLGPAWISKLTLAVSLASKLSCSQPECGGSSTAGASADSYDDHKLICNRDETVRRLGRWYHAAQDVGIIIGALTASFLLSCTSTSTQFGCFNDNSNQLQLAANLNGRYLRNDFNGSAIRELNLTLATESVATTTAALPRAATSSLEPPLATDTTNNYLHYQEQNENTNSQNQDPEQEQQQLYDINYVSDIFEINDYGERICGANSCPVWWKFNFNNNNNNNAGGGGGNAGGAGSGMGGNGRRNNTIFTTILTTNDNLTYNIGAIPLMCIYLVFGIIAVTLTCFLNDIDSNIKQDHLHTRCIMDTLLFAGPLTIFIGTEQGYMLADFTKSFVSCALGPNTVAGALVGMGIMQLIASCTLSMLLKHTKRIVVIAAGFFFHACLLLVLSRWKPSKDDSAILYVIPASWGVCNAVWETLIFALVTITHTNNMLEVTSILQSLKFLGLGITFAAHGVLCEGPKIYILAILLLISVPPYAMYEIKLEGQRKLQTTNL